MTARVVWSSAREIHALRDPLTGFAGRQQLIADLENALVADSSPSVLAVFDLSGLAEYERVLGERAANALVQHLSKHFIRFVQPTGKCYRARKDEFSALINLPIDAASLMFPALTDSLTEEVDSFPISASFGAVLLPDEAEKPIDALMLADERLAVSTVGRVRRDRRRVTRTT